MQPLTMTPGIVSQKVKYLFVFCEVKTTNCVGNFSPTNGFWISKCKTVYGYVSLGMGM